MSDDVIVAEGLVKRYGDRVAVDHVDLRVPRGRIFTIVGPNGAGKTTTLEMIEGIRRPTAGRVRILGQDLHDGVSDVRERIGVLPQGVAMFDRLTVRENLEYFAALYRRSKPVDEVIRFAALEEWRNVRYHRLSGGLKQRLAIAATLVNDPEVVFLDEPTVGLDPIARRSLWDLLRTLRENGSTVVVSTHYMDEAEQLSDVVCFLLRGRVLAEGHPRDLVRAHGGERSLYLRGLSPVEMDRGVGLGLGAFPAAEGTLAVPLVPTAELGRVLDTLGEAGIPTREAILRHPTLDDVFVSLARPGGVPA